MEKMAIKDWEKEQGIMFLDHTETDEKGKSTTTKVKPGQKITGAEFRDMVAQNEHKPVNQVERAQWLTDNGHKVTRENLLNDDLEAKNAPASSDDESEEDE